MSEPLDLSEPLPSRRGVLGLLGSIVVAGAAGASSSKLAILVPQGRVTQLIPDKVLRPKKTKPKPFSHNPPRQIAIDLTHQVRPGQRLRLFYAKSGDRHLDLNDYHALEQECVIPASMHKQWTALTIVDCSTGRINEYSDYEMMHLGAADMSPATRPIMSLDDIVTIDETSSRLNCARHAIAGAQWVMRDLLRVGLDKSDNGLMHAAACYCGQKLIEHGLAEDDGLPGAAHRAFIGYGNRHAQKSYGLSPQFHSINAHGLPGYETLIDFTAFRAWAKIEGIAAEPFEFGGNDRHFRVKKIRQTNPSASLPIESGICPTPNAHNIWGLFDDARIKQHWLTRHPDLYAELMPTYSDKIAAAGLDSRLTAVHGKSGFCNASGGNFGFTCRNGDTILYGLATGQWPVGHRVPAAVKPVNAFYNPGLADQPDTTPAVKAKPKPGKPASAPQRPASHGQHHVVASRAAHHLTAH